MVTGILTYFAVTDCEQLWQNVVLQRPLHHQEQVYSTACQGSSLTPLQVAACQQHEVLTLKQPVYSINVIVISYNHSILFISSLNEVWKKAIILFIRNLWHKSNLNITHKIYQISHKAVYVMYTSINIIIVKYLLFYINMRAHEN